jgi:RNA polymerase sigma-70 factor (ECF subfamily)
MQTEAQTVFEAQRRHLRGVAYRMLGSVSDAEDVVQEAYLRWRTVDAASVAEPRAFLTRVVTRLCLDHLKSARVRRESYVGTWLPEPVPTAELDGSEDLSVALLMTLERLSPLERAAFLLHDVFDVDYTSLAETLERSEAACRQLVTRAREHVRSERRRFEASPGESERVLSAFYTAALSGDASALTALLTESATLYTDGGGKRLAALQPIYGRDKIVRFFSGIRRKGGMAVVERVEPASLNGLPGAIIHGSDGLLTVAFALDAGQIAEIYITRNPDKLRHLQSNPDAS